jgi:methionine aminotransferase
MSNILINSKLPNVGTTIFSVITAEAQKYNAINLAQGFPSFDCEADLRSSVVNTLNEKKNQYAPMAGVPELRNIIGQKIKEYQEVAFDPDQEITITAGATQAIFTAIAAFIQPGDEVIVIEPAYDSYVPAIECVGGIAKYLSTFPPYFSIDWDQLKSLIGDKTKMIIINTPGNPSTKLWTRSDYDQLNQIIEGTNIIVLSDEVYEHLVFDDKKHISPLMIPSLKDRTIAVYSFGKTLHVTGWKIGYVVSAAYLMKEFRKVHQYNVFSVNSISQYGIADYIKDNKIWDELSSFYQKKRDLLIASLSSTLLKPLPSEGSFFVLYGYSDLSDKNDMDYVHELIKDKGVATIPLSSFYHKPMNLKYIRFCFAKDSELLIKAGKKLS